MPDIPRITITYKLKQLNDFSDTAFDSHAFRKDNWKLIVGNTLDPFPFHQVYEEPTEVRKSLHFLRLKIQIIFAINNFLNNDLIQFRL